MPKSWGREVCSLISLCHCGLGVVVLLHSGKMIGLKLAVECVYSAACVYLRVKDVRLSVPQNRYLLLY